jgi:hypothetical protein
MPNWPVAESRAMIDQVILDIFSLSPLFAGSRRAELALRGLG